MRKILIWSLLLLGCGEVNTKIDAGVKKDLGTLDLGTKDGSFLDMDRDSSARGDMFSTTQAVIGKRCDPLKRQGIIKVERREDRKTKSKKIRVQGVVYSKADPFIGELRSSDDHCSFYESVQCPPGEFGVPCTVGEKTSCVKGTCMIPPKIFQDAVVELSNGKESESFVLENSSQMRSGLKGNNLSLELSWKGQHISMDAMYLPKMLDNLKKKVSEIENDPSDLVLSWTPPAHLTQIFTHIPINHHAYDEGTFVECEIESSKGSLIVKSQMLKPLAVGTGLEFQSVKHSNFAAAETPSGCIEIRYEYTEFPDDL